MALPPFGERRSLGLKFLLVCALVLLLMAPALLVSELVRERLGRADAVVGEVGQIYGGAQIFTGPVLVAPYKRTYTVRNDRNEAIEQVENGWYVVFAETGSGNAKLDVSTRTRGKGGLFKVRVFEADVDFKASFNLAGEPKAAPEGAVIDWTRAALLIGVSDTRGAKGARIVLNDRQAVPLEPGTAYAGVFPVSMNWLKVDVGDLARPDARFPVAASLSFSGVESVSLGAFAKETKLRMSGDWSETGYFGAFPRDAARAGTEEGADEVDGFEAEWSIPYVARGLAASGPAADFGSFLSLTVETRLLDEANPYQRVERSLKYALVFIGVVFLAYFLMEATSAQRVHPAQYLLVGLAQAIFYLLLLSIAERIGFDLAFVISAGATVLLIGAYAGAAFKSLVRGLLATLAFAGLYALIYLLMTAEDYALLAGSIAAFVAIAAVMFFTRNVDWYGLGGQVPPGGVAGRRPVE